MGYEQIRNVKKKPKNKYNDESKNNKIVCLIIQWLPKQYNKWKIPKKRKIIVITIKEPR